MSKDLKDVRKKQKNVGLVAEIYAGKKYVETNFPIVQYQLMIDSAVYYEVDASLRKEGLHKDAAHQAGWDFCWRIKERGMKEFTLVNGTLYNKEKNKHTSVPKEDDFYLNEFRKGMQYFYDIENVPLEERLVEIIS